MDICPRSREQRHRSRKAAGGEGGRLWASRYLNCLSQPQILVPKMDFSKLPVTSKGVSATRFQRGWGGGITSSPCSFSIPPILKGLHNCEVLIIEHPLPWPGLGLGVRRAWARGKSWRNTQELAGRGCCMGKLRGNNKQKSSQTNPQTNSPFPPVNSSLWITAPSGKTTKTAICP